MESSSSFVSNSQYNPRWKYDVFLSFRGEDTRKNFTSHLYEGLKNRGIFTFQDNKRLEHGDSIPKELLKAIEESQAAIVVFSKNYAASRWCLNELVKIMECKKNENGETVIPVFYDVEPSHIRYQRESFAEAFAKHESQYKDDVEGMQKVQGWRTALSDAADLKGCDIRDRIESECIRDLVDQISFKLCKTSLSYLQDIVGINTHLEKVKSLLEMEINDVRIVGIWGMGGVGKTTIARAIFDTLSSQFDGACFLADIKENKDGMCSLQNILLSELLKEKGNYMKNKEDAKNMIAHRLRFKKVLVVLDDIDHRDHLDYLAGDLNWYGNGSRIIATTRDKHLVGENVVYEVTTLLEHDAIQLFNQYAFKEDVPNEFFEKLSLEVVSHANGLPLALKVWGSFLYKRDITEWRSVLHRIKNNSSSEIVEKLKISYDGLESEEKEIFLDIACFLRGRKKSEIMQILRSCDFEVDIGLSVLIEKSLVFISKYDTIQMHDLIQDMGIYIVKMQKDPGERSRIWDAEDVKEVMINNTGTNAVEAIWLTDIHNVCFSKKAMKNMKRLRILYIGTLYTRDVSIKYLPNSLRWFEYSGYPCKSLPENFEPTRLVHLDLRNSSLRHLWIGKKHLPFLRKLVLSGSGNMTRTPDFTGMPNLEYLKLKECTSLEEVHPSLGYCQKLIRLSLYGCKSLKRFPCVNVVESLNLWGCSSLKKFPEILGRMKPKLEIKVEPSSIQYLTHITKRELNLGYMRNLVALPSSICKLTGLVKLYVSKCSKLESLPEEIGDLENLEVLLARRTLISRPPSSIIRLNKLKYLSFTDQISKDGVFFVFPQVNEGLRSLEMLDLSWCNLTDEGLPEDIGCLHSLKELYLRGNNIEHLPRSIAQLGALRSLNLSNCKRLKELPVFMGMPNLETLNLSSCNIIDGGLLEDIGCLSSLKKLDLSGNNFELLPRSIAQLGALRSFNLSNCKRLKELPGFMGMPNLETLDLSYCDLIDGGLPEDIGCLSSLKKLDLRGNNFEHLPRSIAQLGTLQCLYLSDCKRLTQLPEFPEQLGRIEADWSNDWICNLLFQNISSLQHDISSSNSLSLRVFTSRTVDCWSGTLLIPSWFHIRGTGTSVSVNLPENWYATDNFLGFAVCCYSYSGKLTDITAHLIPLCDDGMSWMTQTLSLSSHSEYVHLKNFLVPFASLWDTSMANGKTPNDYGRIVLSFSEELKKFGLRLLYKDDPELEALLQMRENSDEHHDEASCSSSKKHSNIRGRVASLFRNFAALSCKPRNLA